MAVDEITFHCTGLTFKFSSRSVCVFLFRFSIRHFRDENNDDIQFFVLEIQIVSKNFERKTFLTVVGQRTLFDIYP